MIILTYRLVSIIIKKKGLLMETRDTIIAAALREFSKNGYHKTSMDSIAETAGLSKGALYYFFKNKTQLFLEIINGGLALLNSELDKIIAADYDTEEAVKKIIEVFVNTCLDNPQITLIVLNENIQSLDTELARAMRQHLESVSLRIQSILEEGEKIGCIKKLNRELVAVSFLGMLAGIVLRQIKYPELDRREIIDTLQLIVIRGIAL